MAQMRDAALISALTLVLSCGGGGTSPPPPPPPPPPAPGPPAALAKQAGDNQTANAGEAVPVAPSVKVTDASGRSISGVTVTFAVASGGGSVTGATPTTGSEGVATVGSWVLGVDGGVNTLSATVAGSGIGGNPGLFTATGQLLPFAPTANMVLQGSRTVASVLIPAGVTVTLAHDAVLTVKGDATIAGTVRGDCVALEVSATGALRVTGTITNVCSVQTSGPAPAMRLIGQGGFELNGGVVTPAGGLFLSDTPVFPTLPAGSTWAHDPGRPAASAITIGCSVINTPIIPPRAASGNSGANGTDGTDGADVVFDCTTGAAVISGTTVAAQNGGHGGDGNQTGNAALIAVIGGNGGKGGDLRLVLAGSLTLGDPGGAPTVLRTGSGGNGGSATATAETNSGIPIAPGAQATGGKGGTNGNIFESSFSGQPAKWPTIVAFGNGGHGGAAAAVAADGDDAKAQPGGSAKAAPGNGGETSGSNIRSLLITVTGGNGGNAGGGLAHAGKGGTGTALSAAGGDGGSAVISATSGGDSGVKDVGQLVGNGGDATDLIAVEGGSGGDGASLCPKGNGGEGGNGGSLTAAVPSGGFGKANGTFRLVRVNRFGNGGNGGNGVTPGLGGFHAPRITTAVITDPSFQQGPDGAPCPPPPQATNVVVQDNAKSQWARVFLSDDGQTYVAITENGTTYTLPVTPGQTTLTTISKSPGSTRAFHLAFPATPATLALVQSLLSQSAVASPFGGFSFTCDHVPANIISMFMAGMHTFSFLGPNGEPTANCILVQVPVLDPYLAFVMRSSNNTVLKLFGANVPLNANTLDLSGSLDPAQVPVTISGANVTSGTILLHLEAADEVFAEHLSTRSPPIGAFSGNTPTTVPLFPTVPAGSVQAVTAYGSPAGLPTSYIVGGVNFFGSAPATATLTVGPPSATLPTATKLVNPAFSQFQVTIPFDPRYDGSYSIEISSQTKGGAPVFTAVIPREVIHGATYVFTVPNVTDMDKVLPAGDLYAVLVTRTGGYAGPPTMMLPAPTPGTSIIFDRTFISIQ